MSLGSPSRQRNRLVEVVNKYKAGRKLMSEIVVLLPLISIESNLKSERGSYGDHLFQTYF